jgi:hypothetical protein
VIKPRELRAFCGYYFPIFEFGMITCN